MGIKKRIKKLILPVIMLLCLAPAFALAEKHSDCKGCHINAEEEDYALVAKSDDNIINPFTGKSFGRSDSLCVACHQKFEAKSIHPVGIVPTRYTLPPESTGFLGQEKEISCFSCHDPHPKNKNYMYLRWPTESGNDISKFCVAKCHSKFAKSEVVLNKPDDKTCFKSDD